VNVDEFCTLLPCIAACDVNLKSRFQLILKNPIIRDPSTPASPKWHRIKVLNFWETRAAIKSTYRITGMLMLQAIIASHSAVYRFLKSFSLMSVANPPGILYVDETTSP